MANAIWPDVQSIDNAEKACHTAAICAFVVAGITGLVAGIALAGSSVIPGINGWAFLDAGIFALLGFFLWRCSRTAAVIALVLFILERIQMMASNGIAGLPLGIVFILLFIGGVRGAFAYHRLQQAAKAASAAGGTIG